MIKSRHIIDSGKFLYVNRYDYLRESIDFFLFPVSIVPILNIDRYFYMPVIIHGDMIELS